MPNDSASQVVRELQGTAAKVCGERVWRTLCKACSRCQQWHHPHGAQMQKVQSERQANCGEENLPKARSNRVVLLGKCRQFAN